MDSNLNLLYLEDDLNDVKTFEDTIKRYNVENEKNVSYFVCNTLEEAKTQLLDRNGVFDAVIIDIKLNNEPGKGNEAADIIESILLRIPCVAFTGTPDDVNSDFILEKFTKATSSIEDVLNYLYDIKTTGLINILGSNGLLEQYLSKIYNDNIKSNIGQWIANANEQPDVVEKALLRHISYCITELINKDYGQTLTDEFYIIPPLNENLRTGSVIKSKAGNDEYYIILSPECDMVLRPPLNRPKTENILICKLDDFYGVASSLIQTITSNDKKIKRLGEVIKNNHTDYYHFVPKCKKFDNKLINFRKVSNVTYDELLNNFEHLAIVSGNYSKDILCRFSTYYSRQGQPDLHFENIAKKILTEMQQRTSSSV